ncbi:MAG: chromosomal replication initiator protein DnaA, partial [Lentisphaeraceae bacterium]|nr:chromosomal replication initiator protein DnaA [Lentisphaeraceae bacterium]
YTPVEEEVPKKTAKKTTARKDAVDDDDPEETKYIPGYTPRFTFDNYVVGDENKFCFAASKAVASAPGRVYNPLFIYGNTGLGKTHLMQAVAQEIIRNKPRAKVEYLSSEEFFNKYIDALEQRKLPSFRRHIRSLDLLLIDDVQFFKGKEKLQEEFFHTFNALFNAHKQIVLTSDRPPHEINGLEKRLVSRFECGQIVDTLPPDYETRLAILRQKQKEQKIKLSNEVLDFIAARIKSNVRRLEGALIRLTSYVSMMDEEMDIMTAQQLLGTMLEEEITKKINIQAIQRQVADHFDIRVSDITGSKRPQNIAFPRQVAMYLSRELTEESLPSIGEVFNRNHATILHAVKAIKIKLEKDPTFIVTLNMLKKQLQGSQ